MFRDEDGYTVLVLNSLPPTRFSNSDTTPFWKFATLLSNPWTESETNHSVRSMELNLFWLGRWEFWRSLQTLLLHRRMITQILILKFKSPNQIVENGSRSGASGTCSVNVLESRRLSSNSSKMLGFDRRAVRRFNYILGFAIICRSPFYLFSTISECLSFYFLEGGGGVVTAICEIKLV